LFILNAMEFRIPSTANSRNFRNVLLFLIRKRHLSWFIGVKSICRTILIFFNIFNLPCGFLDIFHTPNFPSRIPKIKRRSLLNVEMVSLRDMASVVAVHCLPADHWGNARSKDVLSLCGSTIKPDRDPSVWRRYGPASCRRFRSVRPRWLRC